MRAFQKGIILGVRTSRSVNFKGLHNRVAKNCKIFASELESKSGVMRGFQKGITLGGRTSANFHLMGLQNSCLLYTSPSPRDLSTSRMPSSA